MDRRCRVNEVGPGIDAEVESVVDRARGAAGGIDLADVRADPDTRARIQRSADHRGGIGQAVGGGRRDHQVEEQRGIDVQHVRAQVDDRQQQLVVELGARLVEQRGLADRGGPGRLAEVIDAHHEDVGRAGLHQAPDLATQRDAGRLDVGDHLVAGLGARPDLRHLGDDVRGAAAHDRQIGGAQRAGRQERVDLLRDCRGARVAGRVRLHGNSRIAGGIRRPARDGGNEVREDAVVERELLHPDVHRIVIHRVARVGDGVIGGLPHVAQAVAEDDDAGGRELRLDRARTARGQEQRRGRRQHQQGAAQPVTCHEILRKRVGGSLTRRR
jgi:hypothetical protein